jgi:hypothetical protein
MFLLKVLNKLLVVIKIIFENSFYSLVMKIYIIVLTILYHKSGHMLINFCLLFYYFLHFISEEIKIIFNYYLIINIE